MLSHYSVSLGITRGSVEVFCTPSLARQAFWTASNIRLQLALYHELATCLVMAGLLFGLSSMGFDTDERSRIADHGQATTTASSALPKLE